MLIAGDFCPRERVSSYIERGEHEKVLAEIKELNQDVDYSIVNLECPVVLDKATPIEKVGPNLKCSSKGVDAIKWAGFNCVTLANNHFLDFGETGVKDTLEQIRLHGLDHVGGGVNLEDSSRVLYKEIGGSTIAIINCCEHEFSIATKDTAGCNPLDPVKQYYAIREAKDRADYVLVIIHGGHEGFQLPSPRMVETYRFFIEIGADVVVNHHQHCFSGYEVYKNKPILYGLGNFCFDNPNQRSGLWTEGYAVTIDFAETPIAFKIHPYKQCSEEARVSFLQQDYYNERINALNAVILAPNELEEKVRDYYEQYADRYGDVFEPFYNRYYLALKHRGLLPSLIGRRRKLRASNFIICESHRDKLSFWLKKMDKRRRKKLK